MADQGMTSEDLLESEDQFPDAEFTGSRRPLFWLLLRNALFTVLTLGLYRFWAKTWVRQYYWGNVRVFGDPLEYTGRPIELLVGFLIVLAILLPMGGAFSGLEFLAEGAPPIAQHALNTGYYFVIYMLVQVAFYRMWRFRLTRTTWRGIRFGLDGSALSYLGLAILWGLVTLATLGIAFPWMRAKLIEYRMNHSRFGNATFTFHMPVQDLWGLFIPWLGTYLVSFGAVFSLVFFYWGDLEAIWNMGMGTVSSVDLKPGSLAGYIAIFTLFLSFPIFLVWYRTRELQFTINGIRVEGHSFLSRIRPPFVLWRIFLTLIVCGVLFITVPVVFFLTSTLWFGVADLADLTPETVAQVIIPVIILFAIVIGFLFLFIFPVIIHLMFRFHAVWHVCETLLVPDQYILEQIVQSTQQGPSYGEGMADAFDVGAI